MQHITGKRTYKRGNDGPKLKKKQNKLLGKILETTGTFLFTLASLFSSLFHLLSSHTPV